MQQVTDAESMTPAISVPDELTLSTMAVPWGIKLRLRAIKIVDTESDASVIERLLAEHDLKAMQKVVLKRVR